MFKPLKEKEENDFRNNGILSVIAAEGTGKVYSEFSVIPYKIIYRSVQGHWDIFHFDATFTQKNAIVQKLKPVNTLIAADEATLYMFTGWALDRLKIWASLLGKEAVMLTSLLPHITELFVENGYSIKSVDKFGTDKGFLGTAKSTRSTASNER